MTSKPALERYLAMSEKEFVIVDGVRYLKGTEPLSWEEKLKRMNAKTVDVKATAIKTKSKRSRKKLAEKD